MTLKPLVRLAKACQAMRKILAVLGDVPEYPWIADYTTERKPTYLLGPLQALLFLPATKGVALRAA